MQASATSLDRVTDELSAVIDLVSHPGHAAIFEIAAELDLTLSQLRALHVLLEAGHEPALTELAPEVGLSVPATGRMVDHLVRQGLVARREDAVDRRCKRLSLTAQGDAVMDRLTAARREGVRAFAERLSDTDRARLSAALAPILDLES